MSKYHQSLLRRFDSSMPDFQHQSFQALFDHWQSLRLDNAIPSAKSINPRVLAPWLHNMTIMEVRLPETIRYRLTGTSVVARMGIDPTGRNLFDLMEPDMREAAALLFGSVSSVPCAALTSHMNISNDGRAANILSLYLPLAAPEGDAPRVISMHVLQEIVDYFEPGKVTIGSALNHHSWIDIGFGLPERLS